MEEKNVVQTPEEIEKEQELQNLDLLSKEPEELTEEEKLKLITFLKTKITQLQTMLERAFERTREQDKNMKSKDARFSAYINFLREEALVNYKHTLLTIKDMEGEICNA